jgi:septal ring factor EnvC (AmiA/AmiB activator)
MQHTPTFAALCLRLPLPLRRRRKQGLSVQTAVAGGASLVALVCLILLVTINSHSKHAVMESHRLTKELGSVQHELQGYKARQHSRDAEYASLEATHQNTQRRLNEMTSQLQRKEADVASKVSRGATLQPKLVARVRPRASTLGFPTVALYRSLRCSRP